MLLYFIVGPVQCHFQTLGFPLKRTLYLPEQRLLANSGILNLTYSTKPQLLSMTPLILGLPWIWGHIHSLMASSELSHGHISATVLAPFNPAAFMAPNLVKYLDIYHVSFKLKLQPEPPSDRCFCETIHSKYFPLEFTSMMLVTDPSGMFFFTPRKITWIFPVIFMNYEWFHMETLCI